MTIFLVNLKHLTGGLGALWLLANPLRAVLVERLTLFNDYLVPRKGCYSLTCREGPFMALFTWNMPPLGGLSV